MKKKLLAVIALVLMASVIFCGFTVAAEETATPEESSAVESPADEPAIDGGNWFLENWKSLAEALLGTGGVAFLVGLLAFVNKIVQLRATLKTTNVNNADIKNAVNGMIDEISALGEAVKTMKDDNTHAIAVLSDKEADVAAKNEAVCKVIAALISASALPDETKNYLLGDMNSVLKYKDGESNDEESKG